MKNLIFNKDNGIDLMRDHRLFSGVDYQIFSTDSSVKLGIGRKLIDGNILFEGQLQDQIPNGFGRLIY